MPEPLQHLSVVESTGLRRKDTTKGPPLRILSLDGGGVRGYSMLILLQELMHRTYVEIHGKAPKRHDIPKPCEHFDLIAGTGTGGLIAIMLGRLRLDLETCKDVYVRMTKRVFETDKTIAGIPYRSTLFKASKLEEAIRECVREHTLNEAEGKDDTTASDLDLNSPLSPRASIHGRPQRSLSTSSRYSQIGMAPINMRGPYAAMRWGNPNALLYDNRENRTKTAVTAVYKGTQKNGKAVLLRSYDSRAEPPPEFECTIWQAGRATSATGLAFKPIQIGQSVFIDEGAGKYNPAPQILDEAVRNEWPGREVGVFISIGTGKRPSGTANQQHLWWEGFISSGMGDFAEARRRLIAKIEGCEDTHQFMLKEHLARRGVNQENYYRLNVEVGVGEFGMNEWNRLAEISTNTRRYLAKEEVQGMNLDAAAKLARIHRAKIRWERAQHAGVTEYTSESKWDRPLPPAPGDGYTPPSNPIAVELPAEDVVPPLKTPQTPSQNDMLSPNSPRFRSNRLPSIDDTEKFAVVSSDEYPQPVETEEQQRPRTSAEVYLPYRSSNGSLLPMPTTPRRSGEEARPATATTDGSVRLTPPHSPPPLPPKTPLPYPDTDNRPMSPGNRPMSPNGRPMSPTHGRPIGPLPYPDLDGPPPVVNMARKPEIGR
ncbi:Patatin/Phospholipase A2-related protein [Macrophomina phaseolina MS6]|uniref:Patatin/Phospholipase A2-related protein n=2 Tax=Macrophomina phaseolina TaxID=35725 RepID=K2RIH4_MACPH|nr:Patatin/Phospholipase A2-related protein [Macrophomina phaseolina MS6]KAH7060399.1 acyl transferase/acyl hydrolase/lysophospholipase [Macrophomina phaseolina]